MIMYDELNQHSLVILHEKKCCMIGWYLAFFFQTEQMECAIHILYTELPIYLHYTCIVSINPYINKIFTNIMVHNWNTEFNMTRNNSSLFSKICPDLFHDDKTLNTIHNLLLIRQT
uniref:Uncharacterized protein n=1 Tax=Cacopsylla melanoneura TaxID=428564 RepID=A0A8D8WTH3_9HEMI